MKELRQIEIDLEIYRLLESQRLSFEEPHRDILRRVLNLGASAEAATPPPQPEGRAWTGMGVTLPHGTRLRMSYNGVPHAALIEDGAWVAGGEQHTTPSGAAIAVARTRSGGKTNLNGWDYWEAKLPRADEWQTLNDLYRAAHPKKAAGA